MPLGNLDPPRVAPLDRAQPSLALTQTIWSKGTKPEPGGPARNTIGMIQSFAGNFEPFDAFPCAGELFPVVQYPELAAIVGTFYSGDGTYMFGVPELRGRTAIGGEAGQDSPEGSVAMTWMIAAEGPGIPGAYPMTGAVALFAGADPPGGWLRADGRKLPVAQHAELFQAIGNVFGGDGRADFALPDLSGRAVIGAGKGYGLEYAAVGEKVGGTPAGVPGLGLACLVNVAGGWPERTGDGTAPPTLSLLGQVTAFAGSDIPEGWALADGQRLRIAQFPALYSILGTTYGGDGQTSFLLPDLRGRMMTGADNSQPLHGVDSLISRPRRPARPLRTPARRPVRPA